MRASTNSSVTPLAAVALVVLSLLALVGAAKPQAEQSSDRPNVDNQYLVRVGKSGFDMAAVSVVRDLGSGWILVEATSDRTDLADFLSEAGIVWETNTIYELVDDPLFGEQWGLENTGQAGGTIDADIDAPEAWLESTSDPGQVIAVIDSGVDLDHPDLVDRIWVNTGETPGNGVDDDGNGYIDDVNGWDAYDNDSDPNDEYWHGTAVAGTAAASSNGVGVVGVAPNATIMPIRVCNSGCPLSAVVEAIHYAIDNGAHIINLSLGSHSVNQSLEDAVGAANAAGVLVVAAAGNDGANNDSWPYYPASFDAPNVVSVAATDRNDVLASFSNSGANSVDLAAPGKEISTSVIGGWGTASGTSFSAPMVAGAAALVRSIRPGADAAEVKQILLTSVDVLGSLDGKVLTEGRLNAATAARLAGYPVAVATATPSAGTLPFTVALNATASSDPNGSIVGYEWKLPDGSALSGQKADWEPVDYGTHDVMLTVTDDGGNESAVTIQIVVNRSPVAVGSGSRRLGWAPLTVGLNGSGSSDKDGSVVDWLWTSGATSATGANTEIVLDSVGRHGVTLTVTDDFGATDVDFFDVLVGTDFVDTRASAFRLNIAWMSAMGITRGCNPPDNTSFCPTAGVTRGQMAAFIARYLELPSAATDYFTDDAGTTFESDINRIAQAGIAKGCNPPDNDEFCAEKNVTRGQIAAFVARALKLPTTTADYFVDDAGSIFESDINRLAAAGITKGCNPPSNSQYCPTDSVTREQSAAFLHRSKD